MEASQYSHRHQQLLPSMWIAHAKDCEVQSVGISERFVNMHILVSLLIISGGSVLTTVCSELLPIRTAVAG